MAPPHHKPTHTQFRQGPGIRRHSRAVCDSEAAAHEGLRVSCDPSRDRREWPVPPPVWCARATMAAAHGRHCIGASQSTTWRVLTHPLVARPICYPTQNHTSAALWQHGTWRFPACDAERSRADEGNPKQCEAVTASERRCPLLARDPGMGFRQETPKGRRNEGECDPVIRECNECPSPACDPSLAEEKGFSSICRNSQASKVPPPVPPVLASTPQPLGTLPCWAGDKRIPQGREFSVQPRLHFRSQASPVPPPTQSHHTLRSPSATTIPDSQPPPGPSFRNRLSHRGHYQPWCSPTVGSTAQVPSELVTDRRDR